MNYNKELQINNDIDQESKSYNNINELSYNNVMELFDFYDYEIIKKDNCLFLHENIENYIKNIIQIKFSIKSFHELDNIINNCLLIDQIQNTCEKKVIYTNKIVEIQKYFLNLCLKEGCIILPNNTEIKVITKNQELLNLYYRMSNNNYLLLHKVLYYYENKKKIYDDIVDVIYSHENNNNVTVSADDSKNINNLDDSNNNLDDSNNNLDDSNNNPNKYIEINDSEVKLKEITNTNKGGTSSIHFYKISSKTKVNIEKKKNIVLNDKIVVKKIYIDIPDHKLFQNFGGLQGQMDREINALMKLFNYKHFPLLLSKNNDNKYIIMNYCGEPIKDDNVPIDWKDQITTIAKTLKKCNLFNNDVWLPNFLIKSNIIHLIDFGWASNKKDYLFRNINEEDVNITDNLIELLDLIYKRGALDRIKFYKNTL